MKYKHEFIFNYTTQNRYFGEGKKTIETTLDNAMQNQ
jgi:hypothetical protein